MDEPAQYEIRVAEYLDGQWKKWFGSLEILYPAQSNETILRGEMTDQPMLFGVLGKVRDLGLTLISVQRLPSLVAFPLGEKSHKVHRNMTAFFEDSKVPISYKEEQTMQLKDTTMMKKLEELEPTPLARFMQAIARDDWASAEAVYSDDIEWDMMPNSQVRKGKEEVMPFLKTSWTAARGRIPMILNNAATKEWGVVEYWNIGTISEGVIEFAKQSKWPFPSNLQDLVGQTYKVPVCFVYHIDKQGKIDLVREYLDVGSMLTQLE